MNESDETINFNLEEFILHEDLQQYILSKSKILVLEDRNLTSDFIKNIFNKFLEQKPGNIITKSQINYLEPKFIYKEYSRSASKRFFKENHYLIIDNIDIGNQQYSSLHANLNTNNCSDDIFFMNVTSEFNNNDTINYDLVIINNLLKTEQNFLKQELDLDYIMLLNKELNKINCSLIFNSKTNKFMYMKKNNF